MHPFARLSLSFLHPGNVVVRRCCCSHPNCVAIASHCEAASIVQFPRLWGLFRCARVQTFRGCGKEPKLQPPCLPLSRGPVQVNGIEHIDSLLTQECCLALAALRVFFLLVLQPLAKLDSIDCFAFGRNSTLSIRLLVLPRKFQLGLPPFLGSFFEQSSSPGPAAGRCTPLSRMQNAVLPWVKCL